MDTQAEQLHLVAIDEHLRQMHQMLMADPVLSEVVRVVVADLLTWSVGLRWEVRRLGLEKPGPRLRPQRDNLDHLGIGAYWARNQIAHGRAHVLRLEASTLGADANTDAPVPYDRAVPYNAGPDHPVIRFVPVPGRVRDDTSPKPLKRCYSRCLPRRSVVDVVALLLLKQGTPRPPKKL